MGLVKFNEIVLLDYDGVRINLEAVITQLARLSQMKIELNKRINNGRISNKLGINYYIKYFSQLLILTWTK